MWTADKDGSFNTQPPEGGWGQGFVPANMGSRFNTQPPEGGWICPLVRPLPAMTFQHTAARRRLADLDQTSDQPLSFNTQPPEGGWRWGIKSRVIVVKFQHTAARRRLASVTYEDEDGKPVSTHSRPKAAG